MRDWHDLILSPIVTEKTTDERGRSRYTFRVQDGATKVDIKNAIEKVFTVKVTDVNTVRVKGKVRGAIRGRAGRTRNWKKAYVTLPPGQKIASLEA